ncbi:hypothetical protein Leryth_013362 [Lithospermum erythrorhizon]|nr:hypothetical protein Leryth_013362 [Lithospermum erythrorhizon]
MPLQLIAGLSKPTSGSIYLQQYGNDGVPNQAPAPLQPERVGIVFQFPESQYLEQYLFIFEVGLTGIPLDKDPNSLSGGYKRRLAMAVQLVQTPDLLILDEPLAGLDVKRLCQVMPGVWFSYTYQKADLWTSLVNFIPEIAASADIVKLLNKLKKELTLLVVSHDLK